jgi:hypothetical protein
MGPREVKMQRRFLILLCVFSILILPDAVSADCIGVSFFDNFIIQADDTVILYNGTVALVKLTVDCNVEPSSKIRLLRNYLCGGDNILIDDSTCKIVSVKSPSEY